MSDQTKLYRVIYNDGSYLDYELTAKEYEDLISCTKHGVGAFQFSYGLLVLKDVRTIIEARLPEEEDRGQAPPDAPLEWMEWERIEREKEVDEDIDY